MTLSQLCPRAFEGGGGGGGEGAAAERVRVQTGWTPPGAVWGQEGGEHRGGPPPPPQPPQGAHGLVPPARRPTETEIDVSGHSAVGRRGGTCLRTKRQRRPGPHHCATKRGAAEIQRGLPPAFRAVGPAERHRPRPRARRNRYPRPPPLTLSAHTRQCMLARARHHPRCPPSLPGGTPSPPTRGVGGYEGGLSMLSKIHRQRGGPHARGAAAASAFGFRA